MSGGETPLAARLKTMIARGGPIPVAEYMALCLTDPADGYYAAGTAIGAGGDFTTAPEVSQLFGEIVGAFLVDLWRRAGEPAGARLVELGPGRGTLMADVLRVRARLAPAFLAGEGGGVDLVEASPGMRAATARRLAGAGVPLVFHERLPALPPRPTFVLANEFFDALPVRQFQRHGGRWHERMVGLAPDGRLAFELGPPVPEVAGGSAAPDGAIREISPAAEAVVSTLAAHVAANGGALLAIDYGGEGPLGPTLQAVRGHAATDPLAAPGKADLSAHVDFARLAAAARAAGAHVFGPVTQGAFLLSLGLLERAGRLGADKDEAVREEIRAAVERLAGPDGMGELFKVLVVAAPGVVPAGFPA